MCVRMCVRVYVCMFVCCMYVCMYVRIYICMNVCVYLCVCVCTYSCTMCGWMDGCMYLAQVAGLLSYHNLPRHESLIGLQRLLMRAEAVDGLENMPIGVDA